MKTLEDYSKDAAKREKAVTAMNSRMVDVTVAKKRVEKTQFDLDGEIKKAEVKRDEKLAEAEEQQRKALAEAGEQRRKAEDAFQQEINAAKSAVGTAKAELAKVSKKYAVAWQRVMKLLPPAPHEEDMQLADVPEHYKGEAKDGSHAVVG